MKKYLLKVENVLIIPKSYISAVGLLAQPRDSTTREECAAFGGTKSTGE